MLEQKRLNSDNSTDRDTPKPGSNADDVGRVGSPYDFGVRESNVAERAYVSGNTKAHDPGNAQPHAGENNDRQSGVGSNQSGPGSGSGGDIDTDIVGLDGSGLAASGPDDGDPDASETDGTSAQFDSAPPAAGKNGRGRGVIGGGGAVHGTTHSAVGGVETNTPAGADNASNPARGDDSFAAEISTSKASGGDN